MWRQKVVKQAVYQTYTDLGYHLVCGNKSRLKFTGNPKTQLTATFVRLISSIATLTEDLLRHSMTQPMEKK